ncbi:FAD-dependent oxidoreductase [Mycobacterium sp.]|uniref:FAD-dependent oxidoreductase n=1 Tax=Mycobacterium sp. TaxID=1785 RepID=UPI0025E18805|nr:FAD-dependent oxidoreductase [Mycobacterium sp.]
MSDVGEHAVVLGAGIAGLLAARVLSEFYKSVTVVERDRLPDHPRDRRGVPQGPHLHTFLSRGNQVLSELFPGVLEEMAGAGAVVVNDGDLSRIYARVGRCELKRSGRLADPAVLTLCLATRPFVEFHVRRRVEALSNVALLDEHEAIAPLVVAEAVTGVRIVDRDNGMVTGLDADLVVDTTGRAGRTRAFLDDLGYGRPAEKRSPSAVGYSSQRFEISNGCLNKQLVMANQGPTEPTVLLVACEHDTWMLAVGRSADAGGAPADFSTMLALTRKVLPRTITDAMRDAQPLGEITMFRNPAAVWRRYDRMARFPRGLLVMGDALCSLNPIHGQGMTMAALQSLTLRDCLRRGDTDLARRFFHAAAHDIGLTWARNQASDRAPSPSGKPPVRQRLLGRIVRATLTAAAYDITVTERLLRVSHLVDPPSRLNDPALLPHILAGNLRNLIAVSRSLLSRASINFDRGLAEVITDHKGQAHA